MPISKLPQSIAAIFFVYVILALAALNEAASKSIHPAVERAEGLADELERFGGALAAAQGLTEAQKQSLTGAVKNLDLLLEADKTNVAALVAKAKLTALEQVLQPLVFRFSGSPREELKQWEAYASALGPAHQLLDRALAVAPETAEAHFWKARLYDLSQPPLRGGPATFLDGAFAYESQIPLAVRSASRAVELDPGNLRYREEYAQNLPMAERFDDAVTVVGEAKHGLGLLHQLLADFNALPQPNDALPSAKAALVYLPLANSPHRIARVRAFLVPRTAAEMQEFFRRDRPEFTLFQPTKNNTGMYVQYLTPSVGGWRAARNEFEIPQQAPKEGLLIFLLESNAPLIYERGAKYRFPDKKTYCHVWVINYRGV